MPRCSIVIPAYNSRRVLPRTLDALWAQVVPPGWEVEVIVSDDGSTDDTRRFVQSIVPPTPWQLRLVTSSHAGAGSARNLGIAQTTGAIIILLGADIILRPGAVAAHLAFHTQFTQEYAAALGIVTWDPRLHPSRLMAWMMHGGHHNDYDALLGARQADPRHFLYGALVSLKRSVLLAEPFNPKLQGYGWEDLELGRRLVKRGLTLQIIAAYGLHHHYYSVADVCRRQYAAGQSLHIYHRLHPRDGLAPHATRRKIWKHRLAGLVGIPPLLRWGVVFSSRYLTTPRAFELLTAVYFWQGWSAGLPKNSKKA